MKSNKLYRVIALFYFETDINCTNKKETAINFSNKKDHVYSKGWIFLNYL